MGGWVEASPAACCNVRGLQCRLTDERAWQFTQIPRVGQRPNAQGLQPRGSPHTLCSRFPQGWSCWGELEFDEGQKSFCHHCGITHC